MSPSSVSCDVQIWDDCFEEAGGALHTQKSVYVTECVLLACRSVVLPHTVLRRLLVVDKVMRSARCSHRGHSIGHLHVSLGTAQFKISTLMVFGTPARIVAANVKSFSSDEGVPKLRSNICLFILCDVPSVRHRCWWPQKMFQNFSRRDGSDGPVQKRCAFANTECQQRNTNAQH